MPSSLDLPSLLLSVKDQLKFNRIIDLDSRSLVPTEFESLGISQEIIDMCDFEDFALVKACVVTHQSRDMSQSRSTCLVQIQSREAPVQALEIQFKPDFLDSRVLPPKKAYGRVFSCSSKYLYFIGALGELAKVDVRKYHVTWATTIFDSVSQIATVGKTIGNLPPRKSRSTHVYCVDVSGTIHCLCEDTLTQVAKNRLQAGFFFVIGASERYVLTGGYCGASNLTVSGGFLETVVLLNTDLIELDRVSIGGPLATGFRDIKILDYGAANYPNADRVFAIGVRSKRSIAVFQILNSKISVLIPDKVVTTGDIYGLLTTQNSSSLFIYGPNLLKQLTIKLGGDT